MCRGKSGRRNKMHGMLKKKDWCDKKGKVGWGVGFEQCSDIMDLNFWIADLLRKISEQRRK